MRTRTAKEKKTKRNSDPILAFISYISPSDMVHPEINNLTYISRQRYQITSYLIQTRISDYFILYSNKDISDYFIMYSIKKRHQGCK